MHYLLEYDVSADYAERRAAHRAEHLALARRAAMRGSLVLGGALAEPIDRALLVFQGSTAAAAEDFVREDPYVKHGLVLRWRVRPWTTVVGPDASLRLAEESPGADASAASHAALIPFLRGARHGVVASVSEQSSPQAAVVGLAVSDQLEMVFDTLGSTRKAANLRRDPRAAIVITRGSATAQIEGVADEPQGAELERVRAVYLDAFPDGEERASWPGITWFRVRPSWIRTTDFGTDPPRVTELSGAELG